MPPPSGGPAGRSAQQRSPPRFWTVSLILVAETRAPDGDYAELQRHFSEEAVDPATLVGLINFWNRLAIGFRKQPLVGKAEAA